MENVIDTVMAISMISGAITIFPIAMFICSTLPNNHVGHIHYDNISELTFFSICMLGLSLFWIPAAAVMTVICPIYFIVRLGNNISDNMDDYKKKIVDCVKGENYR